MDIPDLAGTFPTFMKPAPPIAVAFREVRHFQPDDTLHCETLAVRGAPLDWTIPAHRHEGLHQWLWLGRGRAELRLDQRPQTLAAPAVLMVAPGCVHALTYEPGSEGWQVTVPSARLSQLLAGTPLLAARLAPSRVWAAAQLDVARTEAAFAALAAEFDDAQPGRADALQAQLLLLVTQLLRRAGDTPPEDTRRALRDTLVQRYRALIELHLRRHRPLADYAEELRVTPDHLSRSCRAVTGLSALDLLHDRLGLEARRLLAYTPATVAEVAHELGFDDPAYFSRFFSRRAGCSPQAWRQALAEGQTTVP